MLDSQSRKRTAGEIDGVISNGTHPNKLRTPKVLKENQMENRQAVCGDSSESHEHSSEAVGALTSSNPITANASDTHEVKLFSLTYAGLSSRGRPE